MTPAVATVGRECLSRPVLLTLKKTVSQVAMGVARSVPLRSSPLRRALGDYAGLATVDATVIPFATGFTYRLRVLTFQSGVPTPCRTSFRSCSSSTCARSAWTGLWRSSQRDHDSA